MCIVQSWLALQSLPMNNKENFFVLQREDSCNYTIIFRSFHTNNITRNKDKKTEHSESVSISDKLNTSDNEHCDENKDFMTEAVEDSKNDTLTHVDSKEPNTKLNICYLFGAF